MRPVKRNFAERSFATTPLHQSARTGGPRGGWGGASDVGYPRDLLA